MGVIRIKSDASVMVDHTCMKCNAKVKVICVIDLPDGGMDFWCTKCRDEVYGKPKVRKERKPKDHDCFDFPKRYEFYDDKDGYRYHGWECGRCGKHLQAG